METIIIETEVQNLEKIKAVLKELNIKFKTKIKKEKPYDPEFVKMVLEASTGKRKRINPKNIWESIS